MLTVLIKNMKLRKKILEVFFIIQYLYFVCETKSIKENSTTCELLLSNFDDLSNLNESIEDESLGSDNVDEFLSGQVITENYNNECEDLSVFKSSDLNCTNSNEVKNLRVVKKTANSLTLKWDYDEKNETSYVVEWFENDEFIGRIELKLPHKRYYTINSLEACTKYKVSVTVAGSSGEASFVTADTELTQPGAPPILAVDPIPFADCKSICMNVSWKEPTEGSRCIKFYEISLETTIHNHPSKNLSQVVASNLNIIFENLSPCSSYLVVVKAVDRNDKDGKVSTFESKPTVGRVPEPPKHEPPLFTTKNEIRMNWNLKDVKSNCSISWVHTECFFSSTEGWGYEVSKDYGEDSEMILDGEFPIYVEAEISDLNPFCKYICYGRSQNAFGYSENSIQVVALTKEDASSPPANFTIVDPNKFIFQWDRPSYMPGMLQKYIIRLSSSPLNPVPDKCPKTSLDVINNIDPAATNYTWDEWRGYSNYTVKMAARTRGHWSNFSNEISFVAKEVRVSDAVKNLKCEIKLAEDNPNALETILSWNLPCSLQGKLKEFHISVYGTRESNFLETTIHSFNTTLAVDFEFEKNQVFFKNLGELRAEHFYTYEVSAVADAHNGTSIRGEVATLSDSKYPSGIPPEPTEDYMKSITLNPDKIVRTSTSFTILLPLFKNDHGTVKYYAVIVSRKGFSYKSAHTRFNMSQFNWPNISSWKESMEQDFKFSYQASEPRWNPYPNYILDYGYIRAVKITIGWDTTCKEVSMSSKNKLYCNGPLKPDTWYEVRMRGFTEHGYSDSAPITVKTSAEVSVLIIVGIVAGILFIGLLTALFLNHKLQIRKRKKLAAEESKHNKQRYYRNRRATINVHPHVYAQTYPVKSKRQYD